MLPSILYMNLNIKMKSKFLCIFKTSLVKFLKKSTQNAAHADRDWVQTLEMRECDRIRSTVYSSWAHHHNINLTPSCSHQTPLSYPPIISRLKTQLIIYPTQKCQKSTFPCTNKMRPHNLQFSSAGITYQ